jgi:hypothetical protein
MAAGLNNIGKTKKKSPRKDPVQAAIDYGIDIQALIDNAGRTIAERIKRHQIALNTVESLQKAKKETHLKLKTIKKLQKKKPDPNQ